MSRNEPEIPQSTIPGLPADFAHPDVAREGTLKTGTYSTPFDVFRGHKPTPEESVAAKHANSAFNRYWLAGTFLGLVSSVAVVRTVKTFNFRTLQGSVALTGILLAGELGGRKLGERAGLKVLLDELPRDSEIRFALEQARRTGSFAPMAGSQGMTESQVPAFSSPQSGTDFPQNNGANAKPRKINQYGDPIEDSSPSGK